MSKYIRKAFSRDEVLVLGKELIDAQHPNLRICVAGGPEADIKIVLGPLAFRSVSLHDESGELEDIRNYIKSVATSKDPRTEGGKGRTSNDVVVDVPYRKS